MEVATTALKLGSPVTHVGPFEKREAIHLHYLRI